MFWNFCLSCRVFLEALLAKLVGKEEDVSSAEWELVCRTNLYFELGILEKVVGRYGAYLLIQEGLARLDFARHLSDFWANRVLPSLLCSMFYAFSLILTVVSGNSLEQTNDHFKKLNSRKLCNRKYLKKAVVCGVFVVSPISLSPLSENHTVILACNMVSLSLANYSVRIKELYK